MGIDQDEKDVMDAYYGHPILEIVIPVGSEPTRLKSCELELHTLLDCHMALQSSSHLLPGSSRVGGGGGGGGVTDLSDWLRVPNSAGDYFPGLLAIT